MIYQILNEAGDVVNRINADEDFVREMYPGRWRLESDGSAGGVPTPTPGGQVPEWVPMLNMHLALIRAGKMESLKVLAGALPDPERQEFEAYLSLSPSCRRDSKWFAQFGPGLGYDPTGLDQLFIAAATLIP